MKGKWKYIIHTIIILNFIYVGLYGYNKFLNVRNNQNNDKNNLQSSILTNTSEFVLPLDYGDKINNIIVKDVGNNTIELSNSNNHFKFIYIIQPSEPNNLNIDYLSNFIEGRENINEDNIEFILLMFGEFTVEKKKELAKIQKKFDLRISAFSNALFLDSFKIPQCKCGYYILLDNENRVRFAHEFISPQQAKYVVEKELKRTLH